MKNYALEKNGNLGGRSMKLFRLLLAWLIILAGIIGVTRDGAAKLSEPDVVYFGTLAGGTAGSFIKLKLDADGTTLATAAVANDLSVVLRVPMDLFDPRISGTARSGDKASLYLGEKVIRTVVIPERGSMVSLSLSATPPTREDWDKLHPGDDGSGDMNRNGISDLQDFLNGNDPAACVWTDPDDSNRETHVYHANVLQNCLAEAQADGRHNLIKVAKGIYYGNFTYTAADGEEFDLRIIGGYDPAGTVGSGERLTTEPSETVLVGDSDKDESKNRRVFDITAGPGQTISTVRLEGLRIMYGGTEWTSDTDRNADGLHGGGVRVQTDQANIELVGNMFSDNFAFFGGALYVAASGSGAVLLADNIISNNAAFHSGAVMVSSTGSGTVTLLNNTMVDNWAENEGEGESVFIESASAPVDLSNNIIHGVEVVQSDIALLRKGDGAFPLTMHNNNLDATMFKTDMADFVLDASNTTDDPMFIKRQTNAFYYFPTDGNYRLKADSPCRDKGVAHPMLPATDPDGRARVIGAAVDIGAYERPLTDDVYYSAPVLLNDPIDRTELVADGFVERMLDTNIGNYTIKGRVQSSTTINKLAVYHEDKPNEGNPWETITLNPDNSFAYELTLEQGPNWLHFEVTKADNVKVSFWYRITLDSESPAVTLSTTAPARTNTAPIPVKATFGKDVTGFDAADVVVTNGSITPSSFSGSNAEYLFTVTPAASGTVSIDIPAGVASDSAGNGNLAAVRLDRVYDTAAPGVILTSPLSGSTYISPIPVSVTFSKPVTAFDAASLIVKNGTISALTVTNTGYTFNLTPTGLNVVVTVDVAAGAVLDMAGNASTAAAQLVRLYAPPIVIEPNLPKTTVSQPGGYYNKGIILTMTATDNADIYYTLDGSQPTTAAKRYTAPIAIDKTTTLRYFAVDVAGNREESVMLSYVIDSEPPVLKLSTLADGKATNNATLNVTGVVSDNSGIKELRINDVGVAIAADGGFSSALTMLPGANKIVTQVVDLAGNEVSDTRTITLDQHTTALLVNSPADNSKTAAASSVISGTTEEKAVIAVKVNGQTVETVTMNGVGFTCTATLSAGINTMEITATNPAGTVTTAKRSVLYDNQKPALAIIEPNQDIRTNKGSVLIKGTVSDSQSNMTVTVNDIPVTIGADGSFEQLIELSEQKSYPILVRATDEVGNETTVQRNIVYDNIAPTFTVSAQNPTNDRNQTIAGVMEAGTTITIECPTATVGAVTYPTAESWSAALNGFAIGNNRITVTGVDAAGNSAVQTIEVTVGNIYNGPKTITLDAPTGMDIYYTTDGTTPTVGSSKYTGHITVTETTAFSYFAVDGQGNRSQVTTVVYTIDTTPPALNIVALSDGASTYNAAFAMAGTVTDNMRVASLTINDVMVPFTGNGGFSTTVTLHDGANTITSVATDMVGNKSTDTRTINLAKDTTNPVLIVSTLASNAVTTNATLNVAGTASDIGSGVKSVMVNGQAAAVASDGSFSVALPLINGVNTVAAVATDNGNNSVTDTRSITLASGAMGLSIVSPADNGITGKTFVEFSGSVGTPGATVTARVNGGSPVAASMNGINFSVTLNVASGLNTIAITATDPVGNSSGAKRSITSAAAAPALAISNPDQDMTTTGNSITITGMVTDTPAQTTITVNACGQSYTPTVAGDGSFIQAILLPEGETCAVIVSASNQTGVLATVRRNIIKRTTNLTGDINGDGKVDISDALKVLRIAVGLETTTADNYAAADLAPLKNGKPAPDGVIDIADALVILEKAVGLVNW
jgi:hypothetical protein